MPPTPRFRFTPFRFPSSGVTRTLFGILGILLVLHLTVAIGHLVFHARLGALTVLADMDLEANLPTFFNAILFFIAAALFFLHGKALLIGQGWGWYLMAGIFTFLGVDEGSQIHEKFTPALKTLMSRTGGPLSGSAWLHYAWVIPYGLAALALLLIIWRWLVRLQAKFRWRLIFSGVVYLSGALGMEMVGARIVSGLTEKPPSEHPWLPCELYGGPIGCWLFNEPAYIAAYTLEETLEMTGLILLTRYLLMGFEEHGHVPTLGLEPIKTDS